MPSAFFCPIIRSSRLPRVTPGANLDPNGGPSATNLEQLGKLKSSYRRYRSEEAIGKVTPATAHIGCPAPDRKLRFKGDVSLMGRM